MSYTVAVVIPTLNEEKFIARCLDSVIAQSYPFVEMDVMVVDGGSKDRTREIVEEYGRTYKNIRFIHNPGRIQSIAFNIGVKNSEAPYIVRLDAHATYNKVYIERCVKNFSANAEVLGCAPEFVGNVGGVWRHTPPTFRTNCRVVSHFEPVKVRHRRSRVSSGRTRRLC